MWSITEGEGGVEEGDAGAGANGPKKEPGGRSGTGTKGRKPAKQSAVDQANVNYQAGIHTIQTH